MSLANEHSPVRSRHSSTSIVVPPIVVRSARSMTCYICLENITTMQKQFGLQNNCDHFFCFDCLFTWRRTGNQLNKDTGGRCPLCRVRSTFIAPSWRCFDNPDDKRFLIDAHKLRLKRIPCRTLRRYGYCRFGRRCYYNHNTPVSLSTSRRWSSTPLDSSLPSDEHHEPTRRVTYNSHRYRPY